MNRRSLYRVYWALERWIAPGLRDSQLVYEDTLSSLVDRSVQWLDIGCGHRILPSWRFAQEQALVRRCGRVVGADATFDSVRRHATIQSRVVADIGRLPFRPSTFDLVTANMVVEHLTNPLQQFQEVNRVLRPGGVFLFHTPNERGYHVRAARLLPESLKAPMAAILEGRREEDVFPATYRANNREAIAGIAERTGFRVSTLQYVMSAAEFAIIAPLALVELIWLRWLMTARMSDLRPNIIAVLQKTSDGPRNATGGAEALESNRPPATQLH